MFVVCSLSRVQLCNLERLDTISLRYNIHTDDNGEFSPEQAIKLDSKDLNISSNTNGNSNNRFFSKKTYFFYFKKLLR